MPQSPSLLQFPEVREQQVLLPSHPTELPPGCLDRGTPPFEKSSSLQVAGAMRHKSDGCKNEWLKCSFKVADALTDSSMWPLCWVLLLWVGSCSRTVPPLPQLFLVTSSFLQLHEVLQHWGSMGSTAVFLRSHQSHGGHLLMFKRSQPSSWTVLGE